VLELFSELNANGRTVVLITHEEEVSRYAKRVVRLRDGRVVGDERRAGAYDVPPRLAGRAAPTEALPA